MVQFIPLIFTPLLSFFLSLSLNLSTLAYSTRKEVKEEGRKKEGRKKKGNKMENRRVHNSLVPSKNEVGK
jgi:hypothetical protein